jgi:NADPH:quinone reductase-like Zn-dependent oxidoreductase
VTAAAARAVGLSAFGGPEVLGVVHRDVPEPGPDDVRIRVRAAAVNPTDIELRSGAYASVLAGFAAPYVAGMDAAGTVDAVGDGVTGLVAGDEVMAAVLPVRAQGGAQSELLVVPAASVVPIPAITGGTGWLATLAIPLAKQRGLTVIADAPVAEADRVRGFGADHVVERGEGLVDGIRAIAPAGVDGVLDTALIGLPVFGAIRDGGGWANGQQDETERGIARRAGGVRRAARPGRRVLPT